MQARLTEVKVGLAGDTARKSFTDQYGAARVAFLRLATVPELELFRKPLNQFLFNLLPCQSYFIDFCLIKTEHPRLGFLEELD